MFKRTVSGIVDDITITIPSMISELSVGVLIDLQALDQQLINDLDILAVLSGIPRDFLRDNMRRLDDVSLFVLPITNLYSQLEHNYDHELIPDEVSFQIPLEPHDIKTKWFGRPSPTHRQVTVKVPRELTIEPAGAAMNAKDIIKEAQEQYIEKYGEDSDVQFQPPILSGARVIAHYFYCKVYPGPYDEIKAEAFVEIVKQLPITQAFPLAAFFFLNSETLSGTKPSVWQRALAYSKKRQAYKRSKNFLT